MKLTVAPWVVMTNFSPDFFYEGNSEVEARKAYELAVILAQGVGVVSLIHDFAVVNETRPEGK